MRNSPLLIRFFLLFCFAIISIKVNAQCETLLQDVRRQFNVNSSSKYLETLDYIYSSTSQSQVDQRSSAAGRITIPRYGTGEFRNNKNKIQAIKNRVKINVSHQVTEEEYLELTDTYIPDETAQAALAVLSKCIDLKAGKPYLELVENTAEYVMVTFHMVSYTAGQTVKVGLTPSPNLTLESDFPSEMVLSGTKTLKFRRNNTGRAVVSLDFDKGSIHPLKIPQIPNDPAPAITRIEQKKFQGNFRVHLASQQVWFDFPNGRHNVSIPNTERTYFPLKFTVPLAMNQSNIKIKNVYFDFSRGGFQNLSTKKWETIVDGEGNLSLKIDVMTSHKTSDGLVIIEYEETIQ